MLMVCTLLMACAVWYATRKRWSKSGAVSLFVYPVCNAIYNIYEYIYIVVELHTRQCNSVSCLHSETVHCVILILILI